MAYRRRDWRIGSGKAAAGAARARVRGAAPPESSGAATETTEDFTIDNQAFDEGGPHCDARLMYFRALLSSERFFGELFVGNRDAAAGAQ